MSKKKRTISRKKIDIEWGDCDPAQIVHFPRYFAYFDACTTALFKKAGLSKRKMLKTYQIIGIPLVDVHASFMAPSWFSDDGGRRVRDHRMAAEQLLRPPPVV